MDTITARDQPGSLADGKELSFERFTDAVFDAHWFRPEVIFLAADGDHWVAQACTGEVSPGNLFHMLTSVLREYRGRGIATALKIRCLHFAKEKEYRSIETNNDSNNGPMLAINRKLGYEAKPGWFVFSKPA